LHYPSQEGNDANADTALVQGGIAQDHSEYLRMTDTDKVGVSIIEYKILNI
jgi:hypothetical protein